MAGEHNLIANAANLSALVMSSLPDLNWADFYLYDGTELVLGPFQGKSACLRIALNRGVCGKAATTGQTQLVPDTCAAMYQYARAYNDTELKDRVGAIDGETAGLSVELDVVLAGMTRKIRFVGTHFFDLRVVLDGSEAKDE